MRARSCICVLGHVYACKVTYMRARSCICVLGHAYAC